jgi:hypothetical protein
MNPADAGLHAPGPTLVRSRPFRPDWTLSWLVLSVVAVTASCVRTPEPLLIREPRPEPVPLRIGVYFPPELRSFTYRHQMSARVYVLGEPSVRLLNEALALLFTEVVEVPGPGLGQGLRADLAGVIEPRIISANWQFPSEGITAAQITYGFTLYSRRGETVASWDATGTGQGSGSFGNFGLAMREAAWKLTSGFRDVPEVRRWLAAEQAVR